MIEGSFVYTNVWLNNRVVPVKVLTVLTKRVLRNHLYDLLFIVWGYFYNFMSTQAEEGIEEGVEDVEDALIDFLIDAVHFDDLVWKKM